MSLPIPPFFHQKVKPTERPQYKYPPQTEEQLAEGIIRAETYVPRKILEQMKMDIDEALEIGGTGISARLFLIHPITTIKKVLRRWTIGRAKKHLAAFAEAELIWKPRLEYLASTGDLVHGAKVIAKSTKEIAEIKDAILHWVEAPTTGEKDAHWRGFDRPQLDQYGNSVLNAQGRPLLEHVTGVEELRDKLNPKVWETLKMKRNWDEISAFTSRPVRYLWRGAFGKRGVFGERGPLYHLTPQKWAGEALKKTLGETAVGATMAKTKKALQTITKGAVAKAFKFGLQTGKKWIKRAVTKLLGSAAVTSISSWIGTAVGSLGGPVGTVIGAVAAPAVTKLTEFVLKIACCSCSCLAVIALALVLQIFLVIGSALTPRLGKGASPRLANYLQVRKAVEPSNLPKDGVTHRVTYSLYYTYSADAKDPATGVQLVDSYDEKEITKISNPSSGEVSGGTITWNLGDLDPGTTGVKQYEAEIKADDDKVVVNKVTISGSLRGRKESLSATGVVVVGNPSGLPPAGWPVSTGCITQGPHTSGSHKGREAIDISVPHPEPAGARDVVATHDGVVHVYYNGDGPYGALGNYVTITSPIGTFTSYYGHLATIAVNDGDQVTRGELLGTMGSSGVSTGLHLHYEFTGSYRGQTLWMDVPYIPISVPSCAGRSECGLCF